MSKAIHITTTFVLAGVDDEAAPQEVADEVMGDIFHLYEPYGTMHDLKVHAQPMPGEYSRRVQESDDAKRAIESDTDAGFSLMDHVAPPSQVRHPYEDGVWIFPEDHPLAAAERMAAAKGNTEVLDELAAAAPKLKELPRGEAD